MKMNIIRTKIYLLIHIMIEWIKWGNIKIYLINIDFYEHNIFIINYKIDKIDYYKNNKANEL